MQAYVGLHRSVAGCLVRGKVRIQDMDAETAVKDPALPVVAGSVVFREQIGSAVRVILPSTNTVQSWHAPALRAKLHYSGCYMGRIISLISDYPTYPPQKKNSLRLTAALPN